MWRTDRLIFVWLYRLFPSLLEAAVIFKPEMLVRWHRGGLDAFMYTLNTRSIWGLAMASYYLSRNGELVLSLLSNEPRIRRRDRPRCGAKTRRGTRCRAPAVWDRDKDQSRNGRCKFHGGLSTGPKTKSGRGAIRASNRRRSSRESAS